MGGGINFKDAFLWRIAFIVIVLFYMLFSFDAAFSCHM